jgi:exodeoxyribonuclease VII large subunit
MTHSDSPIHDRKILTVTQLTSNIKEILENRFSFLWISGEISNYRKAVSKHAYFTLKDDKAQISAVMFRGQNQKLTFVPEDGLMVMGFGRLSVYEPRGTYQIILEYLEPHGIGALLAAFEQLKTQLAAEGLFDTKAKKSLPRLPGQISVITSPSGAVVRDIINVACRRFENISIQVVPVPVQGAEAADEIAAAIELVNGRRESDVIILARGGGSMEDLSPFNSERLARAIFASRLPVVSAIGHETDFTIADFTADLRASTPSAAAELVVPDKRELLERRDGLLKSLHFLTNGHIRNCRRAIGEISKRLIRPDRRIQTISLRLDEICDRLIQSMSHQMKRKKRELGWMLSNFTARPLQRHVATNQVKLDKIKSNLQKFNKFIIEVRRMKVDTLSANLEALNPTAILSRGYSILRTIPAGAVVTNSRAVDPGEPLEVILARGTLRVEVEKRIK